MRWRTFSDQKFTTALSECSALKISFVVFHKRIDRPDGDTDYSLVEPTLEKPYLRGHFHQAAFFLSLGASGVLIAVAHSPLAQVSAIIYGLCLALLFGVSSLYHRINWPPEVRKWIQKIDHASIFIFIAGTGTPISVLGLPDESGRKMLIIFWASAAAGVLKEFLWKKAPRWSSGIFYALMGWLAAPMLGQFQQSLGWVNTGLLLAGGAIYTLGAVIYSLKRPNPSPKYFGFHELFHLLVVIAGLLHFIVIFQLVTGSR